MKSSHLIKSTLWIKKCRQVFVSGVVVSSKGRAARYVGGVLGQFDYDEKMEYYIQTSTEQSQDNFKAIKF